MPSSYDPAREELYQIAGDRPTDLPPELAGGTTGAVARGTGRAFVRYTSKWAVDPLIIEMDIYAIPGVPIEVHLICPKCLKALKISQANKAMEWSPPAPDVERGGGVISIAPFECTWELTDQVELGGELCRWKAGVTNNVARDA